MLSDHRFDYGGATYSIASLYKYSVTTDELFMRFDGLTGAEAKTALGALTLWVDGRKFAVSDFSAFRDIISYDPFSPTWSDGQTVSLVLTAP